MNYRGSGNYSENSRKKRLSNSIYNNSTMDRRSEKKEFLDNFTHYVKNALVEDKRKYVILLIAISIILFIGSYISTIPFSSVKVDKSKKVTIEEGDDILSKLHGNFAGKNAADYINMNGFQHDKDTPSIPIKSRFDHGDYHSIFTWERPRSHGKSDIEKYVVVINKGASGETVDTLDIPFDKTVKRQKIDLSGYASISKAGFNM